MKPMIYAGACLTILLLAGCDQAGSKGQTPEAATMSQLSAAAPATPDAPPAGPATDRPWTFLVAAEPAATVALSTDDDDQTLASVVRVDPVSIDIDHDVKLFGVGGGDPAMNGLNIFLAVYRSPAEGWWVYRLADVLDYRVLRTRPDGLDVEMTESTYDEATGQIGARKRGVIVSLAFGDSEDAPPVVRMAKGR